MRRFNGRARAANAIFAGSALIILLGGAVAIAGVLDHGRAQAVSQAEAIATVEMLAGKAANLKVVGTLQTGTSRAYTLRGNNVDAAVDMATGQIGYITLTDRVPIDDEVAISADVASKAADRLFTSGLVSAPNVKPTIELVDHGTATEYQLTWQKRINEVIVPDSLVVRVNPVTGDWYSFIRIERSYAPPPKPVVSRDAAIATSQAMLGSDARLESADLLIVFAADGTQRLGWSLKLVVGDAGGYEAGQWVIVDAISGKQISLAELGLADGG